MIYGKGFILAVGADTPEDLEECRKYIARHKLGSEDVSIKRVKDECVKVVAKREVEIKGG